MIFGNLFQSGSGAIATIADLRRALDHLQSLCIAAGAKGTAKDIEIFSDAIAPHDGKAVAACCSELKQALSRPVENPKAKKKASGPKAVAADPGASVQTHLAALRGAGGDQEQFNAAFVRLKADKSVKAGDAAEIAHQFALTVTKYKSKAAAFVDIEKAFVRQARFENKLR